MLFRRRKDIILPSTQPSGATAQTLTFRIKQEQRRLDGFFFKLNMTPAATTPAAGGAWGGFGGIVKEIRVRINDVIGTRNVVQVSGVGLLSWVRENVGFLDRDTSAVYRSTGFPILASTPTIDVSYYVPIRHPLIEEPFGNYLSLPLSQKYLGDDVIVEVDLYDISTSGPVFSANVPTYSSNAASIQTLVREVPESWGYIPSELRTDYWTPTVTASAAYEFTSNGYLTGALLQGFSTSAIANSTTRTAITGSGGQIRFELGREILFRDSEQFNKVANDLSKYTPPSIILANIASSTLYAQNFVGETFFDFLSDLPGNSAFSVASVPNLYTSSLGGDKARLILNDAASTTIGIQVTQHRLLPAKADDLKGLAVNI